MSSVLPLPTRQITIRPDGDKVRIRAQRKRGYDSILIVADELMSFADDLEAAAVFPEDPVARQLFRDEGGCDLSKRRGSKKNLKLDIPRRGLKRQHSDSHLVADCVARPQPNTVTLEGTNDRLLCDAGSESSSDEDNTSYIIAEKNDDGAVAEYSVTGVNEDDMKSLSDWQKDYPGFNIDTEVSVITYNTAHSATSFSRAASVKDGCIGNVDVSHQVTETFTHRELIYKLYDFMLRGDYEKLCYERCYGCFTEAGNQLSHTCDDSIWLAMVADETEIKFNRMHVVRKYVIAMCEIGVAVSFTPLYNAVWEHHPEVRELMPTHGSWPRFVKAAIV